MRALQDKSNGYEAIAGEFISRARRPIGASVVRQWARALPRGASILDIGCGHGVPIAEGLMQDGFAVHGVDASATMIDAFRERFPHAPAECSAVEDSESFGRTFDGVVAWGLMFLLDRDTQRLVVRKVSRVLRTGGKFLFTSPAQTCAWPDAMTGRTSLGLGFGEYREILDSEGLTLVGTQVDEGDNHYYFACRA